MEIGSQNVGKVDRFALRYFLYASEELSWSENVFRSLINDLGSDAAILADALNHWVATGDHGCPHDVVKAILWLRLFDSYGDSILMPKADVLRNGVALDLLCEDVAFIEPAAPQEPEVQ